jgi:hypothetical protein
LEDGSGGSAIGLAIGHVGPVSFLWLVVVASELPPKTSGGVLAGHDRRCADNGWGRWGVLTNTYRKQILYA